jgi:hypothetical protein
MIDTLPLLTPDPKRSAQITARCRGMLDKRAAAAARSTREAARSGRIERGLTAGLCALYLSSVVVIALRVFGAF